MLHTVFSVSALKKKLPFLASCIIGLSLLFLAPQQAFAGQQYYVSTTGSDTNTGLGRSDAEAWQTLNKALTTISPGDDVIVLEGTYAPTTQVIFNNEDASLADPTYFQADEGATVIIDGVNMTALSSDSQSIVEIIGSKYIYFEGFTITHSGTPRGRGITVRDSDLTDDYIYIRDNIVHDIKMRAIGGTGEYVFIENNTVYNSVLVNVNGALGSGGWPVAIGSFYEFGTEDLAKNFYIRNNTVYDNWGEGIGCNFTEGMTISGNVVHDNFSVNIYVDTCRDVEVTGNYIYTTDDDFDRSESSIGHARGVSMSTEDYSADLNAPDSFVLENIEVSNNIIVNTSRGVNYYHDPAHVAATNTYTNIDIFFNTIYRTSDYAPSADYGIFAFEVTGGDAPSGTNEIRDNIIYNGGAGLTLDVSLGNAAAWTFSHNDWVDGIPSSGTHTSSVSVDPLFTSPATTEGTVGATAALAYKPLATSTIIGLGLTQAAVTTDYASVTRAEPPTIGALEATAVVADDDDVADTSGSDSSGSGSGSSGGGGGGSVSAPHCGATKPGSAPDLFQIDVTHGTATLYITPAGQPFSNYFVSYGYTEGDERFGVQFDYTDASGVIVYQISHLDPNTTYYFKVRAGNDCMPGEWSSYLGIKTPKPLGVVWTFYANRSRHKTVYLNRRNGQAGQFTSVLQTKGGI